MNQCADRQLVFGVLAVQMDFVRREDLLRILRAWTRDKARPLADLLVEAAVLSVPRRELLESLVQAHLETHGTDARMSLESLASARVDWRELERIGNEDPQAEPTLDLTVTLKPALRAAGPRVLPGSTRYEILRLHARGGLGEVFVARDSELNREVALKEIQQCYASEPRQRARFLLEAEVTGALQHPGIVPVYGLGAYPDGRPFYAMRFIQGDSLKDAVAHFHEATRGGRPVGETTLALRKLLGHFLAVCNAIEYAHSRGILHRDIKPANIMVGQYGETLVVDWGIAKVIGRPEEALQPAQRSSQVGTSDSSHTLPGAAIGTPSFMSPEQALAQAVGPATDIYSLGATLYALLTGQAPFTGPTANAIMKKVAAGAFQPPRQVNPLIAPALAAICVKAMALAPADRYASAALLARDIEHWLADEPVAAHREPWTKRVGRWARRHKSLVVGAGVLLVTAVVSLAVSTILILREQSRTQEQRLKAEANFRTAETNFRTARQAVNDMLTEVAMEQLAYEPGMEKRRLGLLKRIRNYYTQFLAQKSDDPSLRADTAIAYKNLADISRQLGEHDQAREAYGRAIELLTGLTNEYPATAEHAIDLAYSYNFLGEVQRTISRTDDADKAYRDALRVQTPLADAHPNEPAHRKALARIHSNLGILYKDTQRPQRAEQELNAAIAILKQLVSNFPDEPEYRQLLARGYSNLGPVLRASDRPEKAEEVYREAIRLQTALVAKIPRVPDYRHELAVTYNNLGFLLLNRKRLSEARQAFESGIELFDHLSGQFPSVPVYRKELANTQNNLALVWARDKKWTDAETAWRRALGLFENLVLENADVPDYQGNAGMVRGNLGWLALQQEDFARAEQHLVKAMAEIRVALGANPRNPTHLGVLRDQHEYLADALVKNGKPDRAAKIAEALTEIELAKDRNIYLAAKILARCAAAAKKDDAEHYASRAVALLLQAFAQGYRDRTGLTQEPFLALAQRDDFKKLLTEP